MGKMELYADLLYFLRFGSLWYRLLCSCLLLVKFMALNFHFVSKVIYVILTLVKNQKGHLVARACL